MLNRTDARILLIDVQEKLFPVMARKEQVVDNIVKILKLAELYDLPILWTEQYPRWLGSTIEQVKDILPEGRPIEKMAFNCCLVDEFNQALDSDGSKQIILAGLETHICVYQTCCSLLEKGYEVYVPRDAVDSRTEENLNVGLDLMKGAGAIITSTETIIYQILEKAGTNEFKEMLRLIK